MAGETLLDAAISTLQQIGFFKIVLPFILFFAVIFAILERTGILGEGRRNINAIVAFVLSLIVTGATYVTGIIEKMIPLIILVVMILLFFLLIFGLIGGREAGNMPNAVKIGVGIAAFIAVILIFLHAADLLVIVKPEIWATVIFVLVLVAAIAVIVSIKPVEGGGGGGT